MRYCGISINYLPTHHAWQPQELSFPSDAWDNTVGLSFASAGHERCASGLNSFWESTISSPIIGKMSDYSYELYMLYMVWNPGNPAFQHYIRTVVPKCSQRPDLQEVGSHCNDSIPVWPVNVTERTLNVVYQSGSIVTRSTLLLLGISLCA